MKEKPNTGIPQLRPLCVINLEKRLSGGNCPPAKKVPLGTAIQVVRRQRSAGSGLANKAEILQSVSHGAWRQVVEFLFGPDWFPSFLEMRNPPQRRRLSAAGELSDFHCSDRVQFPICPAKMDAPIVWGEGRGCDTPLLKFIINFLFA